MGKPSDLTVHILRQIRDEIAGTNKRLDALSTKMDTLSTEIFAMSLEREAHALEMAAFKGGRRSRK